MKKQIARISVHQTSKVLAILYAAISLLYVPVGVVIIVFGTHRFAMLGWIYLFVPVFVGLLGYPFAAFICWIYDIIARKVGGVEFTVVESGEAA